MGPCPRTILGTTAMFTALLMAPGILLADDGATGKTGDEVPSLLELVTLSSYVLGPLAVLILYRSGFWRNPTASEGPPPTPWRLPASLGIGLFLACFVLGGVGAGIAGSLLPPDVDRMLSVSATMWGGIAGMGCACAIGGLAWYRFPKPAMAPPVADLRTSLIKGLLAALLIIPIVQLVSSLGQLLQIWMSGTESSPLGHETLRLMVESAGEPSWWLLAGAAVLGAPLVEEVMYRGLLQQSARRVGVGPIWSSILTGGIFSLMHVPALPAENRIAGLSGLLVLGIGLGLLRERTGRLDACILVHVIFNGFNLLLATTVA